MMEIFYTYSVQCGSHQPHEAISSLDVTGVIEKLNF